MIAKTFDEAFRVSRFVNKSGYKIQTVGGKFELRKGGKLLATLNTLEAVEAFVIGRESK